MKRIVLLSSGGAAANRAMGLQTSVLLDNDGAIARAYGATVTPHMYIIDAKGTLVYKGGIDSIPSSNPNDIPKAKQYVRVALDEVLAGKPVTEASTRPYGCSLKYGNNAA